jgi:hypothetical protein
MRSEGPSCRVGQAGTTGRLSRAVLYGGAGHDETRAAGARAQRLGLDRESYRRKATACQMAAQSPSDKTITPIKGIPD